MHSQQAGLRAMRQNSVSTWARYIIHINFPYGLMWGSITWVHLSDFINRTLLFIKLLYIQKTSNTWHTMIIPLYGLLEIDCSRSLFSSNPRPSPLQPCHWNNRLNARAAAVCTRLTKICALRSKLAHEADALAAVQSAARNLEPKASLSVKPPTRPQSRQLQEFPPWPRRGWRDAV